MPPCRPLTCEIVSIGDEMTSGARLDTNAQWLSRRMGELGVTVQFHSTVGDTLDDNINVFRIAASRADLVVATGGLGPTRDDLTRESLAAVVGQPLEMRESAMKHIESMYSRRNREMPERNRVQAMFPVGSDEIFNPQGTAPGIDLMVPQNGRSPSRIFALPGVPAEMVRMFDDTVAPRVMAIAGGGSRIRHAVMKFFGTGESDMEQRLGEMISRDRQPRVGITVSAATISLRITATADTDEICDGMIAETRREILQRVPEFYFGDGETFEQHHAIAATLRCRDQSMAIVELGRAAVLGDWFATLGDSPAYRGGVSLADTDDLCRIFDAANPDEALQNARQRFAADWMLLVDQYPALDNAADARLPNVDVALTIIDPSGQTLRHTITLGGHPDIMQARIAKSAMAWMRKVLQ
ncbi:Putative competence-damage inducible protein [Rubripirellula lacrimiformis]|uniref:Competence-damage inducible protein n=1 Tax=Rubripirellula lacrimiformis TaxID=1930273 RepID=A0A517NH83_9BACT|nr:molybdopterin-binding protein [Rubripirellula lacrimiformis]QDT06499.1 Putative competence-damage inducible protein [Rubripirellula lacrimiformis]